MRSSRLRTIAGFVGLDRDIVYALASRFIAAGGQLVTLGLISFLMPPAVQGYHFTFLSFVAVQTFFELGFYLVVVNNAAHEWAHLRLGAAGAAEGDPRALARLGSLCRFSLHWYAVVSVLYVALLLPIGWIFFSERGDDGIAWLAPWIALTFCSGLQIWGNAALSFLEGCGQISTSYKFRSIAAAAGQLAGWAVLAAGGNLWTAAAIIGTTAATQLALAARRYAPFWRSLRMPDSAHRISWWSEIWPLQWRLGLQGVTGFFLFSLFTPVAFHYYGAVAAGRVGLTWTLVNGFYTVMTAWLQARAPRLAVLVAQNNDAELDQLFRRTLLFSTLSFSIVLAVAWSAVTIAELSGLPIAQRLLPPAALAFFCGAALLLQLSTGMSIYFRAHKQDPSTALNILTGLTIGAVTWATGAWYGPTAMAAGFFLVLAIMSLPCQYLIYLRYRRKWHPRAVGPEHVH